MWERALLPVPDERSSAVLTSSFINSLKQAIHMHIPLASSASLKVKLQIVITSSRLADVLDRRIPQRSAAKVGMQDYAGWALITGRRE